MLVLFRCKHVLKLQIPFRMFDMGLSFNLKDFSAFYFLFTPDFVFGAVLDFRTAS